MNCICVAFLPLIYIFFFRGKQQINWLNHNKYQSLTNWPFPIIHSPMPFENRSQVSYSCAIFCPDLAWVQHFYVFKWSQPMESKAHDSMERRIQLTTSSKWSATNSWRRRDSKQRAGFFGKTPMVTFGITEEAFQTRPKIGLIINIWTPLPAF